MLLYDSSGLYLFYICLEEKCNQMPDLRLGKDKAKGAVIMEKGEQDVF